VEVHQADGVRLRHHIRGMRLVLVVVGDVRPDLLCRELSRQLAQRALLVAQGERDSGRRALFDRRHCSAPD
jgi:hypothetical protein